MDSLEYNDSTIGSARPLADDANLGSSSSQIYREKEEQENTIEYIPKRMSKLSDEELNKLDRKMTSCSQNCSRALYKTIIGIVSLSLVMTAIVHIFAWYQDEINGLSSTESKIDWFSLGQREASEKTQYLMETEWTFWVWIAVYVIQLFWLFYGMVLTCRRAKDGFLYERARTMPVTIYFVYLLCLGGIVGWYFLWGRFLFVQWAALDIGITALITHVCLAMVLNAFVSSITDLQEMNKTWDLLWNQLFTQNGIAALATWLSINTMYNITNLLLTVIEKPTVACSIGLGIIMFYMLLWTLVDLGFSRRCLYYIYTPYLLVIVSFASAFVRNLRVMDGPINDYPSLVVSAIFLGITVLFLLVKIIAVAVKGRYSSDDKAEVKSLHDDNVYVMQ